MSLAGTAAGRPGLPNPNQSTALRPSTRSSEATMKIQPQLLTLDQLLQGRLFRIPEYQRSYSWGAKQRADLFSDILRLAARGASAAKEGRPDDESHFMA
jgi:hypothetical protein